MASTYDILKTRRFLPFFGTQFLGAFNDNVFKQTLTLIFAYQLSKEDGQSDLIINIAAGLFILPFFLFSSVAGEIADGVDKAKLIRRIKFAEILIMISGAASVFFGNLYWQLGTLFLMGAQSAFFGPAKYSILPQHLQSEEELVSGNSWVELGTFLAILLGTVTGGLIAAQESKVAFPLAVCVLAVAIAGYAVSRQIPAAPPAKGQDLTIGNPITSTFTILRDALALRSLRWAIIGISVFWGFGSLFIVQLPKIVENFLNSDNNIATTTWILASFSIGIALGSLLAAKLSGKRLALWPVSLGLVIMPIFLMLFVWSCGYWGEPKAMWIIISSGVSSGIGAGLYNVPLYALLQHAAPEDMRSRAVAANNIINSFVMVAVSVGAVVLLKAGLVSLELILCGALLLLISLPISLWLLRLEIAPILAWVLVRTMYRVKIKRDGSIPQEGAALLVANHVSFIDAILIQAITRRPIRFVMDHRIYRFPVINWIMRALRIIPIANRFENPELLKAAMDEVSLALQEGELVGIFPEGKITRDGTLNEFKKGMERILERDPVKVVPIGLNNVWGSFFSRKYGPAMTKPFARGTRTNVFIRIGDVMPESTTSNDAQEAVSALLGNDSA